jgi:hypothetical protein
LFMFSSICFKAVSLYLAPPLYAALKAFFALDRVH